MRFRHRRRAGGRCRDLLHDPAAVCVLTSIKNEVYSSSMTLRQTLEPVGAARADDAVSAAWYVTVTSIRPRHETRRAGPAGVEADARSLGVDLRLWRSGLDAGFVVAGPTLRAATDTAFDRWEVLRRQLSLPDWPCSSIVVTAESAAHSRAHRPTHPMPGYRFPYSLWSTA